MSCCWLSREYCAHLSSLYLHLCTFCKSEYLSEWLAIQVRGLIFFFPYIFRFMSFIYPMYVIECNKWAFVPINLYNFQQRISWLSHRWRTQRNAISNVNCRIQWIIESLNAPCAPWYSEEHACLSVINISTSSAFACWVLDLGVFFCWILLEVSSPKIH